MAAPVITITDAAAQRIEELIKKRGKDTVGIRIGVKSGGCSGLSYTFEYADSKAQYDEVLVDKGVTVLIDPKAVMYLIGTKLDFIEEEMKSGFAFINPNEKGRCGCGESFKA